MRKPRENLPNRCYHLISRVAHRAFFLDAAERTRFVEMLKRVAEFSGVRILAYCVMTNHFHIFIYVGYPEDLTDEQIIARMKTLYQKSRFDELMKEWEKLAKYPESSQFKRFRESFVKRMWNASEFMKTLKQHFTMSFNGRLAHAGTMWESRFRVRARKLADLGALMHNSAYIDANPVNARMADWPDKYEWCSFAAACSGDESAISGYDFIYSQNPFFLDEDQPCGEKGRPWSELKELHEHSIREILKSNLPLDEDDEEAAKLNAKPVPKNHEFRADLAMPMYIPQLLEKGDNVTAIKVLQLLELGPRKPAELRLKLGIKCREYFNRTYLAALSGLGLIERTDPEHPNSPRQMYTITAEGRRRVTGLMSL